MVNLDVLGAVLECTTTTEDRFDVEAYSDSVSSEQLFIQPDIPLGALVNTIEHHGTSFLVVDYLIIANEHMSAAECIQKITKTTIRRFETTVKTNTDDNYLRMVSFIDSHSVSSWSIKCSIKHPKHTKGLLLTVQYPLNGYRLD